MEKAEGGKFDQIIAMLGDVVDVFSKRFDKVDDDLVAVEKRIAQRIDGVDSKVDGINRRLDTEAMQRTDLKLPRRVHEIEEQVYGAGKSQHPKQLPL